MSEKQVAIFLMELARMVEERKTLRRELEQAMEWNMELVKELGERT